MAYTAADHHVQRPPRQRISWVASAPRGGRCLCTSRLTRAQDSKPTGTKVRGLVILTTNQPQRTAFESGLLLLLRHVLRNVPRELLHIDPDNGLQRGE